MESTHKQPEQSEGGRHVIQDESPVLASAIAQAEVSGDMSRAAFLRRLDDGHGGIKPSPVELERTTCREMEHRTRKANR